MGGIRRTGRPRPTARLGSSLAVLGLEGLMPVEQIAEEPRGRSIPVFNPATGEQIAEVPDGGPDAVNEAVARARETFRSEAWRGIVPKERAKILWRVAEVIDSR